MRCKNCGTYNDDNRYICENCGSPLYDEAEISEIEDGSATQTFAAVNNKDNQQTMSNAKNGGKSNTNPTENDYSKAAEKKSIIVIAVLAVVLVAIIVSVVLVAQANKKNNETVSVSDTSSSSGTTESTSNYVYATEPTTESTTASTTKESTTQSTTKQTTTELRTYSIKLISKGGGTVEGAGNYEDGSNVTIVATPDGDYEFDGWYSNGQKISSSNVYSFTATKDISISAVFTEITTENNTIENQDGELDV